MLCWQILLWRCKVISTVSSPFPVWPYRFLRYQKVVYLDVDHTLSDLPGHIDISNLARVDTGGHQAAFFCFRGNGGDWKASKTVANAAREELLPHSGPARNSAFNFRMMSDALLKTTRYREFEFSILSQKRQREFLVEFPYDVPSELATAACSTRVMAFNMQALPPCQTMEQKVEHLLSKYGIAVSKYWEQGLLQMMFWNNTAVLEIPGALPQFQKPVDEQMGLKHLYHSGCSPITADGQCAAPGLRYPPAM